MLLLPSSRRWNGRWFAWRGRPVRAEPLHSRERSRVMIVGSVALVALPSPAYASVSSKLAHLTDEALVALVARGDETALAELYDRIGRVAYGLAYRVLRDEGLAQDAVQEAFLTVWRTASTYSPARAKASTWGLTLVHRRAVDLVRREERRRAEPLEQDLDRGSLREVSREGTAEEAAWLRFERERVQEALRRLPDAQREAIELAYYGGYSQAELAEKLGQPLGTIKSRMFTGLARLRELLDEGANEGSWRPEFTS